MAKARLIDEKTFRAVKIMLDGKASYAEITEFLNVSSSSITRIRNSENFDEFKKSRQAEAFIAKKAAEGKAKEEKPVEQPTQIVEHRQSVTLVANHYMAEQLQKQTELLTLISNKLGFIVDELCGVTKKEG